MLVRHFKFHHAMSLVLPLSVYKNMMNRTKVLVDGSPKYKCPECSCVLRDFRGLKVHLQIHNRDREYICSLCKKSFVRQINLDCHIKSVHQKIHNFSCHLCERTFSTVANLREHMNIHIPSKKHVCEVCGQAFVHKGSLNTHKFSHGTPFTCNHCGKNYANPLTFKTHILENHSNLPKYVCDICGKELKTESNLQKHMVVHSNERPFICPICNASYKMKKHLRQHQRQRHENKKVIERAKQLG
uniref:PR domain zinc finger protein 5 n=3 Tax=Cacopsylla melanoneura TaxID=428564 RepID=A0A8D8YM65_9HEMI